MPQSIQERAEVLAVLRVRATIATNAMYALIGKEQPVQQIRYQVVSRGKAYHIVERATGKARGFRWNHAEAINFAESLERRANLFNRPSNA